LASVSIVRSARSGPDLGHFGYLGGDARSADDTTEHGARQHRLGTMLTPVFHTSITVSMAETRIHRLLILVETADTADRAA